MKALAINDIVVVNHRTTAFLSSYFDVVFALNRMTHPGEKRMLENVKSLCGMVPKNMERDVVQLINDSSKNDLRITELLHSMTDILERLLMVEGLI